MHTKRLIGLFGFLIGLALIIFALYANGRPVPARDNTCDETNSPFGKNKVTEYVDEAMESKIAQYDQPIFWCLVGGIVLAVVGGALMICCGKHKKRRR